MFRVALFTVFVFCVLVVGNTVKSAVTVSDIVEKVMRAERSNRMIRGKMVSPSYAVTHWSKCNECNRTSAEGYSPTEYRIYRRNRRW